MGPQANVARVARRDSAEVKYATNPEDDKFIQLLIRVVEQCVVYEHAQAFEQSAKADLLDAQLKLDSSEDDFKSYESFQEPALDRLLELTRHRIQDRAEKLEDCQAAHDRAQVRLCTSRKERRRLLSILYERGRRFIVRDVGGEVECDRLEFDEHFREELARLMRGNGVVRASSDQSNLAKKALISKQEALSGEEQSCRLSVGERLSKRFTRLVRSDRGLEDSHGQSKAIRTDLASKQEPISADRNAKTVKVERKRCLADYRDKTAKLERQIENQTKEEQNFFLNETRAIFVKAAALPPLSPPAWSLDTSDLSRVDPRPKEVGSDSALVSEGPVEPERQRLQAARAAAAKAKDALSVVQDTYMWDLATNLLTYDQAFSKKDYDEFYSDVHDGKSYQIVEAEAAKVVRQAEVDCEVAWDEAVAAGITDLPPSPKDLGDRSEDGRASSCASDNIRRLERDFEPQRKGIREWRIRVARAGTPLGHQTRSPLPSAEQGNLARSRARIRSPSVEGATSKSRIERYTHHQTRKRKRAEEEKAERASPSAPASPSGSSIAAEPSSLGDSVSPRAPASPTEQRSETDAAIVAEPGIAAGQPRAAKKLCIVL